MRLVADGGLWSIGPAPAPVPLAAVVEVDGAVLSWTVDASDAAAPQLTLTDAARADWLWRVVGASGHHILATAAAAAPPDDSAQVELAGLQLLPGSLDRLRRVALGNWLRRFWPASTRDGIAGLDPAVLDAEIAVAIADAEDFFGDGTLDSDIAGLLAPHAQAFLTHIASGDARVLELARRCVDLADEVGLDAPGWVEVADAIDEPGRLQAAPAPGGRDDYALAAGTARGPEPVEVIARGVASMAWTGVPGSVFDAAEDTVEWTIATDGPRVMAVIRTQWLGPQSAAGIPVSLRGNGLHAAGALGDTGRATLPLADDRGEPATTAQAWDADWSAATVTVGVEVDEPLEMRQRVRRFARRRLAQPESDAFLAEILAAESDY